MTFGKEHRCRALGKNRKLAALLVSLFLVLTAAIGATIAYLVTHTDPVVNTFTPGKVDTEIVEEFDGDVKENVTLKNTGDVEAYIRAAVVVSWKDDQGNVLAAAPVQGTDYTMELGENTGWFQASDSYYYFSSPVAAGDSTGILIQKCAPITQKEGYTLSVEIIGSAIQSSPASVVEGAWGVTVGAGGVITKG